MKHLVWVHLIFWNLSYTWSECTFNVSVYLGSSVFIFSTCHMQWLTLYASFFSLGFIVACLVLNFDLVFFYCSRNKLVVFFRAAYMYLFSKIECGSFYFFWLIVVFLCPVQSIFSFYRKNMIRDKCLGYEYGSSTM